MGAPYNQGTSITSEVARNSSNEPTLWHREMDKFNYIITAIGSGAAPTTVDVYQHGCTYVSYDGTTGQTAIYENVGTPAAPSWRQRLSSSILVSPATIATTGNTDAYVVVSQSGILAGAVFSGVDALAASDTNYVTFSITNLGQAGAGTNPMLAATAANTTKVTGGSALAANTKRTLTLNGTASNLVVAAGDRLLVRVAATGTLANTVTYPVFQLLFA